MRNFFGTILPALIGKIVNGILGSFNNSKDGFSARKMTAFATMLLITHCVWSYVDSQNVIQALLVLCMFVLILLGLIVVENLVELVREFKNTKSSGHEK